MSIDAGANVKPSVHEAVSLAAAQVLGLDHVDLSHNFFDLGGSSLSVALLTEQLESTLGVHCPMQLLYENPRLADFVDVIQTQVNDATP